MLMKRTRNLRVKELPLIWCLHWPSNTIILLLMICSQKTRLCDRNSSAVSLRQSTTIRVSQLWRSSWKASNAHLAMTIWTCSNFTIGTSKLCGTVWRISIRLGVAVVRGGVVPAEAEMIFSCHKLIRHPWRKQIPGKSSICDNRKVSLDTMCPWRSS